MAKKIDSATFLCSLSPLQSALQVHGSGDGMRIRLDVPQSEMAEAIKMIAWGQRVLKVTVEPEAADGQRTDRKPHY